MKNNIKKEVKSEFNFQEFFDKINASLDRVEKRLRALRVRCGEAKQSVRVEALANE